MAFVAGSELREMRTSWGLTQVEASEKSGVDLYKIRLMENDKHSPCAKDIYALGKLYKQKFSWFFKMESVDNKEQGIE